jgi:[acyl-carrier-protein] S-malonyltransferase
MDYVLLLPGQGSQRVGMGKDLAETFPASRAVFDAVDDAVGTAVSALAFEGPADELTRTHNAQVALLAHSAAAWAVIRDVVAPGLKAAAGHSLGEFSAYHVAGALDVADAARIVRRRGELMYEQGLQRPGAMAAVLGVLNEPIDRICEQASADGSLVVPANFNNEEQVVISGEVAGVERAMQLAKAAGAKRCVLLPVSGAFHSPLMAAASDGLDEAIRSASLRAPTVPVYANVDAAPVTDAATAHAKLVQQLTAPVRWMQVMQALAADFPQAHFIELGAGNVLTGLAKRIAPGIRISSCGTVADLRQFLDDTGRSNGQ